MFMTLAVHISAGALALIAGFIALYSAKGARVHRKSGMVFVYAMLTMALIGAGMAAWKANNWSSVNVSAGLLTSYLVITSLTTVRPPTVGQRWLTVVLMLIAGTLCLIDLTFAFQAIAGGGKRNGVPAFPFVMFGVIALLATIGDLRMLFAGGVQGSKRIARHLWRMSYALFIAAMSFFIGQAKVIPKAIRIRPLLALPVLAVLVTMLYWLWRVRIRRNSRPVIGASAPEAV